jgi:hypothetical protein
MDVIVAGGRTGRTRRGELAAARQGAKTLYSGRTAFFFWGGVAAVSGWNCR